MKSTNLFQIYNNFLDLNPDDFTKELIEDQLIVTQQCIEDDGVECDVDQLEDQLINQTIEDAIGNLETNLLEMIAQMKQSIQKHKIVINSIKMENDQLIELKTEVVLK